MQTIITSGYKFVDIDAFACIYAYQELLLLQNIDAKSIITAPLNSSIPAKFKSLGFYEREFDKIKNPIPKFILMDISDPIYFEKFVDINSVHKIYDHHPGFADFWKEKLGENALIEDVGAAATLIFQEFENNGFADKVSSISAELLAAAILSNTLNFQSLVTKKEDVVAYEKLKKYFDYDRDFENKYFEEIQNSIEKDLEVSLKDDSKWIEDKIFIGQLEVWNAKKILKNNFKIIEQSLSGREEKIAFLNLIEIEENRNHIIFRDHTSLEIFREYFPEFEYSYGLKRAYTQKATLRKEILKRLYEKGFFEKAVETSFKSLAEDYLKYYNLTSKEKENLTDWDPGYGVHEFVNNGTWQEVLKLIDALCKVSDNQEYLAFVGAGPFEDFLNKFGSSNDRHIRIEILNLLDKNKNAQIAFLGIWVDRNLPELINWHYAQAIRYHKKLEAKGKNIVF